MPTLMCGLFAGCAILSKYFGLILVASCFCAALVHEQRKAYFKSYVPYISFIVAFMIVLPHIVWLFHDGFQPLLYLASKADYPDQTISYYYFEFLFANILYFIVPMLVIAASLYVTRGGRGEARSMIMINNGPSFMTTLAILPFVLTLIAGSIGHVSLTPPFGAPIFALIPLVLLRIARPPLELCLAYTKKAIIALMLVMAVVAPFVPYVSLRYGQQTFAMPRREAVDQALILWRQETARPLRIIAGSIPYNFSLVFRSPFNTSEFRDFNFRWSPWITEKDIYKKGMLVICDKNDQNCLHDAQTFMTPDSKTFERPMHRRIWGYDGPEYQIEIIIIPPHSEPKMG
jgi:Dolichyl-phosphate-mannose-protein mannosyltransferase